MFRPLWALVLAVAALVGGCASGPTSETVQLPAADAAAQTEYRIGPGDTLQVFVWNQPELTVTVPVRPDGMISTPLISGVPAAGKTAPELAKDLQTALSEFVRNPTVSVMVTSFVGTYADQIRVVGQAAKPQSLPYRANMTLLDVMIAVGGLGEFAAGNRAVIVRQEGDQRVRMQVRLRDLLDDGDVSVNVPMRPGDVLIIPESRF
ncbi:MAG: polysaccharide export protein [Gammaproteobacteria bacterium]|nr:polysaccharide export protein [Gammaproteobacteria bacterium]